MNFARRSPWNKYWNEYYEKHQPIITQIGKLGENINIRDETIYVELVQKMDLKKKFSFR